MEILKESFVLFDYNIHLIFIKMCIQLPYYVMVLGGNVNFFHLEFLAILGTSS